ncbi:MAG: proline iminopeptidase-like protein [Cercozoa sp. M6MM]
MSAPEPQKESSGDKKTAPVRPPEFELTEWNAVAMWSWDIDTDICAICRNHIQDRCIDCQANPDSHLASECTMAIGTCSHAYHFHCISRWLTSRNACPICNQDWHFQRTASQGA